MTKEEFEKLEKICKDSWAELAESGAGKKPDKLSIFSNKCPACEISLRADGIAMCYSCNFCPIDKFRNAEIEDPSEPDYPRCQNIGMEYAVWMGVDSVAGYGSLESKAAALSLSRLSWTFLPSYESVDVEDLLERFEG